ncbi:MAG: MoaD/ThiS family protein [Pseudomonadota bacterium]
MIQVKVEYFAVLREQRGTQAELVETAARTPADLYLELAQRHDLRVSRDALRVAVNEEFCAWDAGLGNGDVVVFIPPVAGG